jgi:glycoside hydrolase-like protein
MSRVGVEGDPMANFCNYPRTEKISEIAVPNSLNAKPTSVTIGLNGYKDFDGNPLEILHPPYVSVRKGDVIGDVQLYELSSFHPGRWVLEARTQAGITWDRVDAVVDDRESFFAGFDRLDYPGDSLMKTLFDKTNLCWCGFYLAPAPSQGKGTSWMSKKSYLQQMGWGMAPIYVGQQTVGAGSHNVTAAQGKIDAQGAAKLAAAAGFDTGSIVFLDIESGPPATPATLAYYDAWASELEDHTNYSPGVYCSFSGVAQSLYNLNRKPVFWVFSVNQYTCGPAKGGYQSVNKTSPFPTPDPAQSGVSFAKLWQYVQAPSGCGINAGGHSVPSVDFDSSTVQDPSNPLFY